MFRLNTGNRWPGIWSLKNRGSLCLNEKRHSKRENELEGAQRAHTSAKAERTFYNWNELLTGAYIQRVKFVWYLVSRFTPKPT